MAALTKADIAHSLIDEMGLSKHDAKEIIEVFYGEITEAIHQAKLVKLSGFGNFELNDKEERPGRNPKTGEMIPVSARRVVTFRSGQKLRARVKAYKGGNNKDKDKDKDKES